MATLASMIADAIDRYHVLFMQKKVLKTVEEIEATTNPLGKYIAGAGAVDELYNNLVSDVKVNDDGKLVITKGGADSVLNFSSLRLVESNTDGISVPPRAIVVPLVCNVQPKIIVTYATDGRHSNLYWEQHAFGFEGSTLLFGNSAALHLRAYDVTNESFKIKSYNETTYKVKYWCFA